MVSISASQDFTIVRYMDAGDRGSIPRSGTRDFPFIISIYFTFQIIFFACPSEGHEEIPQEVDVLRFPRGTLETTWGI